MQSIDEVLTFWFGTQATDQGVFEEKGSLWFGASEDFDRHIKQTFEPKMMAASRGELQAWEGTPRGRLALVVLLDQFPRNVYRGTPQAFAYDAQALALCRAGVARGDDRALRPVERMFLYMPLMHAEELAAQDESIALFERLVAEHEGPLKARYQASLDYSHKHRELIRAFGRFPHRNEILGRETTEAEARHLAVSGESFGQTKR